MLAFLAAAAVCAEEAPLCTDAKPYEMWCDLVDGTECKLGVDTDFNCTVFPSKVCQGERSFDKPFPCRYCYQVAQYECEDVTYCKPGLSEVTAKCWSLTPCLGPSTFEKRALCKRASKSQKTAVLLSLFLGAFAADRYYLGHYVTAVFKMLTFGGLGFAYFIDLLLICFGWLGPADGSLYSERV